jgi:hypothetical protein
VQDLAALNRVEVLCWDSWAETVIDHPDDENSVTLLDEAAAVTLAGDEAFDRIQSLYQDERLRLPSIVNSWSPAANPDELPLRVPVKGQV